MSAFTIILLVLASIASLGATVAAFIFLLPEKKREKLPKIAQFAHDFFNFKFMIIEKILQFTYVLSTVFSVLGGFAMLFYFDRSYSYSYYGGGHYTTEWRGYIGFLMIIFGPIAIRLVYEVIMMGILLVKNVIQINNKIKTEEQKEEKEAVEVTAE